ncbi:MAG: hypothetical protein AB7E32_14945, partial [Desulfovibrio sp.]
MRIRDTGKSDTPSLSGNSDRGASFRRLHRVGEHVTGRVLRVENGDMAWVSFDGEPLLTHIPHCPRPGSLLTFLVLQIHPEITLRQALNHQGRGGGVSSGIQEFYAARAAYEAALDSRDPLPVGQKAYLAALDAPLIELLQRVLDATAAINAALEQANRPECLAYPPWLAPRAREMELLTALPEQGLGRAVFGLRLAANGAVQIRAMLRPPLLRCRVYAEQP